MSLPYFEKKSFGSASMLLYDGYNYPSVNKNNYCGIFVTKTIKTIKNK